MKHRASLDRVMERSEKETLDRGELEGLLADVKPESRSSETVGTVRALRCGIDRRRDGAPSSG